jgi:hypothetical protein
VRRDEHEAVKAALLECSAKGLGIFRQKLRVSGVAAAEITPMEKILRHTSLAAWR